MRIESTRAQARAIVGGMAGIAAARGKDQITAADRISLQAAYCYLLRQSDALDPAALAIPTPGELAAALPGPTLRTHAARLLTVMAFIDGRLDTEKIEVVLRYAAALDIHEPYVREITEAAHGEVHRALVDMTRRNMESITGRPFLSDDASAWFLPYTGDGANPALAARYQALGSKPEGTLGRSYWEQYTANHYAFPGEPAALNEAFATPHDCTHILSGYDTSARGELLVSTFTAAMHPVLPLEGHILPVIFSWHLGIQINDVAGAATGALDPAAFWDAWDRGAATSVDLFKPDWDFWSNVGEGLETLRQRYGIPPPRELAEAPGA